MQRCEVGDDGGVLFPAVVELKTIAHEDAQHVYGEFFADVEAGEAAFKDRVPDSGHRVQLLQHAAACRVKHVLYVRGSVDRILSITLVHFDEQLLLHHVHVLSSLHAEYFSWISTDPENHLPDSALDGLRLDGKALNLDRETATVLFKCWQALHALSEAQPDGLLPAAAKIQPRLVGDYNTGKHPIDTSDLFRSKLAHCLHLTHHQALFLLLVDRVFINFHYLERLRVLEQELRSYDSTQKKMQA